MHSIYKLTTLSCPLLSVPAHVLSSARSVRQANFSVAGKPRSVQLGRLMLLRGFETAEELATERRRALSCVDPFLRGGVVTALSMESYTSFPFCLPFSPNLWAGGIYEFRTCHLLEVVEKKSD
jgi:hypothetical protein